MRGIIGIHQFRYPRDDSKWRSHTRQDMFAPSRYFLWNYNLPPAYTSPKNPVVPASFSMNYNRYGLPPMPSMLHHPNYIIAMQNSQLNNYAYRTTKDLNTKSKPGNFHHITIFNAIIPKPYMPLATVPLQLGQQPLRSPRNNKPLVYYNKKGRQVGNANKSLTPPPPQFRLVKQNDNSFRNATDGGHTLTNTFHLPDGEKVNNDSNNGVKGVNNSLRCGQKPYEDYSQADVNAPSYYCNNLATYESGSKKRQIQQQHILPTATLATTQPDRGEKSQWANLDVFTSPKPIFLPTIYEPRLIPIAETTTSTNNKASDKTSSTTATVPSFNREVSHRQSFFTLEEPRHTIYEPRLNHIAETTTSTNNNKARDKTSTTTATVQSFNREVPDRQSFFTLEEPRHTIYEPRLNHIAETTTSTNNKASYKTSSTTATVPSFNREVSHRQNFFSLEEPYHTIYEPRPNHIAETTTRTNNKARDKTSTTTETVASFNREVSHSHGFFTLEDAITRAPPRNYIFNDPYEALSHARKHKELQSKQTSTKKPSVSSEKNSLFLNFFDDITETPFKVMHFNRSRFVDSPSSYFSYMNNGINTNWDSVFKSDNPYVESIGHKHNTNVLKPYFHTTPTSDVYSENNTTTYRPILYGISNEKATTFTDIEKTTLAPISTTEQEYKTTQFANEKPIGTTAASPSTTTPSNKVKTTHWKHPFYGRSPPTFKMRNNSSGILAALKNSTHTSTTFASSKKKAHKYQRRYKPKKAKLFKPSIPTTLSTFGVVQPTPSTIIGTTTKEISNKTVAHSRTVTTSSPTEASATKAIKSHPKRRLKSHTRNSQRLKNSQPNDKGQNQKEQNSTTAKPKSSKSRRRVYTSSTTANAHLPAPTPVVTSIAPVTSPSYTATTLRSTARKSNGESKAKFRRLKTSTLATPHDFSSYTSAGTKHLSRTVTPTSSRDGGVPPLPIEIYFKNSQNVKV